MKRMVLFVSLLTVVLFGSLAVSAQAGHAYPVITPENAEQIEQLVMLGRGHVYDLAWSQDGRTLAVASSAGIWLYDAEELAREPTLLHSGEMWSVAYSLDGTVLAGGDDGGKVYLWDTETWQIQELWAANPDHISDLEFHPDGTRLIAGGGYPDYRSTLWDIATVEPLASFENRGWFSLDGVAITIKEGQLWDVVAGEIYSSLAENPEGRAKAYAFSPNEQLLMFGAIGDSYVPQVWDAVSGEHLFEMEGHVGAETSTAFSADGKWLAYNQSGDEILVWDITTGQKQATMSGSHRYVSHMAFSPDGTRLASAGYNGTLHVWDVRTGEHLTMVEEHIDDVKEIVFTLDGLTLVAADTSSNIHDGTVRRWDIATGEQTPIKNLDSLVLSVAISPDGERLAFGTWDGTIWLWHVATGTALAELDGHTEKVYSLAFSPDAQILVSGGQDNAIRLWDVKTAENMMVWELPHSSTNDVVFSPDGAVLAAVHQGDYAVTLWDVATRETRFLLKMARPSGAAFNPDGTLLAVGSSNDALQLWQVASGEKLAGLELEGDTGGVRRVAWSPNGTLLAAARSDHTVRLWDATTGASLAVLEGHTTYVTSVVFSPDGSLLASSSEDGTVRIWGVPSE